MHFFRQFSTLQDAGLPILRSLNTLEKQYKPGRFRRVIKDMSRTVQSGATLAEAMGRHGRVFDATQVKMVAVGEAGGVLEVILQRLADFMENAVRIRRKLISAMIYPACVLIVAIAVVIFMLTVVVPILQAAQRQSEGSLPGAAQALVTGSNWFLAGTPPGWVVVVLVVVAASFGLKFVRQAECGRYSFDLFKLKLPLIGRIVRKAAMARAARTLGLLIHAGVPILEALRVTRDATGNSVYARALGQVHDAVQGGEGLTQPLLASRVIESHMVDMVHVGEQTGELDRMLFKVADNYESDVEMLVQTMISLLEPTMIIILGLIVATIIFTLILPLIGQYGKI